MAAFNFPNSPSTNDLHTENGVTYKWNGTVWKRQNASYTDATNLNVTGIATFANNVSIGGVLTYEDVKNVDSVGIVTARDGIKVTGGTLNVTNSENTLGILSSTDDGANLDLWDNDTQSRIRTVDGQLQLRADVGSAVSDSSIRFFVDGANEKLRITGVGSFGINNSDPKYTMHFKNAMSSSPSWIHMEVTGSNTEGGGGGIAFDTSASNDASNNGLFLATIKGIRNSLGNGSNDLVFSTSTNAVNGDDGVASSPKEKLRINSDGRVLIGHSSARISSSTVNPIFQLEGIDHHSALGVIRNSSSAYGSYLVLGKSRSSSVGGYTILQDNDAIGAIRFAGADGVDMAQYAAEIQVQVDGTPGADSMPGEMIFRTNTGSGNPTEKLRITKQGIVSINDSTPESFATLQIKNHTTSNTAQILLHGADQAQIIIRDENGATNQKCTTIRNDQGNLIFGTHNDSYSGFQDRLYITTGGNIGVNCDSPTSLSNSRGITLQGSGSTPAGFINFMDAADNSDGRILADDGELHIHADLSDNTNASEIVFHVDNSRKACITSDGRFGLGLTDPNSTLHLATEASPAQGTDFATLSLGSPTQALRKVEVGARRSTRGGDWDNVGIGFKVHESNDHTVAPEIKMVLDYDGNLGIGTVDPTYKLHVQEDTSAVARFERTDGSWAKVDIKAGNNTGNSYLTFSDTDASEVGAINYEHNDNSLRFEANNAERARITSGGTVVIEGGANDTANVQLQDNNIGGVRVAVNDEAISAAIYLPRDGAMVLITGFSNPDANGTNYPQPSVSGMVYVDCGPSRNIQVADLGSNVGYNIVAKTAYTGTVSNCDNNKLTVMGGNTEGTFRLVNRIGTDKYLFCITML